MRVTNSMLSHSFLRDMSNNLSNLKTLQQQMTSGKEISKPSDNPFKVARSMQLHTDINTNDQYKENIKDSINWLDTTDTALGQAGDVLQRVRELLVSAGNASYGDTERQAIKDEINEKVGELSQIMNTNFDGKYIFGGTRGTTKPLESVENAATSNIDLMYYGRDGGTFDSSTTDVDYLSELNMIGSDLSVEISQGVTMEYNVSASEIMEFEGEDGTTKDLMTVLKKITSHLDGKDENNNVYANALTDVTGEDLQNITDAISNILKVRSEVGAKQNRMDSALEKNTDETANMTEILAETEDIDITEKTMEYATMQTVYVASLQTSAKVLQPSLLDYLG